MIKILSRKAFRTYFPTRIDNKLYFNFAETAKILR